LPYISVSKDCMKEVLDHASGSEGAVIGLLTGRWAGQVLVIEGAIRGRGEIEDGRIVLTGEELAKIADDILSGRVKGNIVGWYHSHPGRGAYLSDIDISTQSKLQQFSPNIVSMVIDPKSGDLGFFFLDPITREPRRVGEGEVFEFNPGEDPIPPWLRPPPPPRRAISMRSIVIAAILMALIGGSIPFLLIYSASQFEKPTIQVLPASGAIAGEDLELSANVTEGSMGLDSVALFYRTKDQAEWTRVQMARRSGSTFYARIPAALITGDVAYFISARDKAGNVVESPLAIVGLRRFELIGTKPFAKLYADSRSDIRFEVIPVNGFSSEVGFEVLGLPEGVGAEFDPPVAIPKGGESVAVSLKLWSAGPGPTPGEYDLSIRAIHGGFSRSIPAKLLIPTFDISIQPPSSTALYGGKARFNVSISRKYGFDRELKFEVRGLPSEYFQTKFVVPEGVALPQGPTSLVLEIYVDAYARIGTYDFKLIATGGGIEREVSANLKVSRVRTS
jgi:proteasome lid subunit RPN8/RPN11